MSVVLDASAALAVLVKSQATIASGRFFVSPNVWKAPGLFQIEVRNALFRLERKGALPQGEADHDFALLESGIVFAPPPNDAELAQIAWIARRFRMNAYDAAYVALALSDGDALASRDGPVLAAAIQLGLEPIDLR